MSLEKKHVGYWLGQFHFAVRDGEMTPQKFVEIEDAIINGYPKRESVEYVKGHYIGVACFKHDLVHNVACGYCFAHMKNLLRNMLDNDPNDSAADAVTVLDVWRKEVSDLLNQIEDQS